MKILVTGGAGFIGSNVVEGLLERNHEVVVLDDFSFGNQENLTAVRHKIKIIFGSILDEQLVMDLTKGIDAIIHLAAASASPMFFLDNVRTPVQTNIDGFLVILKAAVKNNISRVVYASSSSLYGNNSAHLDETTPALPPNVYAATKLSNEYLAKVFSSEYDLETIGFRFLSVYGPHEEGKGKVANLVSQFIWSMLKNEKIVIYGDGQQKRDFVYVKDVVQALILAVESKNKFLGEIFNVASGQSLSLNELVAQLNQILGKSVIAQYIKNPVKNYIVSQNADISKICKFLSYSPEYTLEKGLRDMIPQVKLDLIRT